MTDLVTCFLSKDKLKDVLRVTFVDAGIGLSSDNRFSKDTNQ